jgi:NifU-like protein involved in Fe-S cluster formation
MHPPLSSSRSNADGQALIDHYTRPRNAGSLDRKDPSVGSALVGAPACGDVIRLDIQVDEATGTIVDARFKTFGCGSAIASSSYLTTLVKGKRRESSFPFLRLRRRGGTGADGVQWRMRPRLRMWTFRPSCACRRSNVSVSSIVVWLVLTAVVHCSLLAEDAIKAAIKNYETKRAGVLPTSLAGTSKELPKEA